MKKIWFNFLFAIPLVSTPLIITSCASVSQYGTQTQLSFSGISNTEFNGSSNFSYDYYSGTVYKGTNKFDYSKDKNFVELFKYIEVSRSFIDAAVTLAHVDSAYPNPLFKNSISQENLKEFLFASANLLNQGGAGDIKFGVTKVAINVNTPTYIFPEGSGSTIKIKVDDKDTKLAYFETPASSAISMALTYGYYDAGNQNVFNNRMSLAQVKDYIKRTGGALASFVPTKDTWNVTFDIQAYVRPVYSLKTAGIAGSEIDYSSDNATLSKMEMNFFSQSDSSTFLSAFKSSASKFEKDNTTLFSDWFKQLKNPNPTLDLLKEFGPILSLF